MGYNVSRVSTTTVRKVAESQENATVETPSLAQAEMEYDWELITDLLGGTEAMRAKATTWLPMEPKEKKANYLKRLARSFLHPAFEDTVDKMANKPFEVAVQAKTEELPRLLQPIVDDVDLEGTSLTEFARQAFEMALGYGLVHCLVEAPLNPERRADPSLRPYFVLVPPTDFIGGSFEKLGPGAYELSRVRSKRTRIQTYPGTEFGQLRVPLVQVYGKETIETWEIPDGKEAYQRVSEDPHTYNSANGGGVPFATLYFDKKGRLKAAPPLKKLAWLNLEHWQKSSDLSNIVRFASVGTLFLSGVTDEEKEQGIVIGPQNCIMSTSDVATAQIVEHSGKAVQTIEDHVRRIEERMEIAGLEPYMRKTGSETATGKAMHGQKSDSAIKVWIRATESWLVELFEIAARWMDRASGGSATVEIPKGWRPKIFDDFQIPLLSGADDADKLLQARKARELSHQTYLEELKRRGFLSEDVNSEDELARMESEPAAGPAQFGVPIDDTPPGDDDAEAA